MSCARRDSLDESGAMEEPPSNEMEPALLAIGTTRAEARRDALMFADRNDGDVAEIERKIHEAERRLASGAPEMRPGMSPRIYQEAFVTSLREALAVVAEMKRRGEEEDLDLAFGRRRAEAEGQIDAWLFASKNWRDRAAIEARIAAGPLAVPLPASIAQPMAPVFPNYYTMAVVDTLVAALEVVKTLGPP